MSAREIGIKSLSTEQRITLERELLARIKSGQPGIPRRDSDKPCPLSFAQQRLWFLEQIEGNLVAYNMPFAWRLRGKLNNEALRVSLESVVGRHEPLRTNFEMVGDEVVQIIRPNPKFALPLRDFSGLTVQERDREVGRLRRAEASIPFDLTSDLMIRASLLRIDEFEHVLLLTMHHIASDGWSVRILAREIEAFYDGLCFGRMPLMPDFSIQYADYAVWQGNQVHGAKLSRQLEYWRKQLHLLPALNLPTDHRRPTNPSCAGDQKNFAIDNDLVDQLTALSSSEGVTLHMTLLAAFQSLMARYSGQDDFGIGMPIAGRNRSEIEDQIGCFVNTLVLRASLSDEPTFRQLLSRVRETSLQAYENQELPFEKLVEELQPERHLNRSPLVQVMFQLTDFVGNGLNLRDVVASPLAAHDQNVRFDLEVHLRQRTDNLSGTVSFSTELYDHITIDRMIDHYLTILQGIVANPDQSISELPLMTESERHQLLVQWNGRSVDYPKDQGIHKIFQQCVDRTPHSVAIIFEEQTFTYRELNERANQLAHYLTKLGVRRGAMAGVSLARSEQQVIGILGILKAGAAYVPLDPDYPTARLEEMIDDAGVEYLVTQSSLMESFVDIDCQRVCLDLDAESMQRLPVSNPSNGTKADDIASVMYTSGSTGRPKGVAVPHRAIARLVFGNDYAAFGPDRVFLQLATMSFDASTFEVWGSLLHGAKLVIAPVGLPEITELQSMLQIHGVTTLWLTATLFNQIVEDNPDVLQNVEEILTGGEALSVRHIRMAQESFGEKVQLINGYGPTENTTFTSCYRIPSNVAPECESIPIGRPISNTQVYLLDSMRNLVPIGVPGELYVGGAGLARGYVNQDRMTAEKFVENPFSEHTDSRLYRTGDVCRWRNDGVIEFLGRMDDQIKLRGYRIELGEIESALSEHPDIKQCVVALRSDEAHEKFLVGYIVPRLNCSPGSSEVRAFLKDRLPDYMVPSAIIALESLPTTSGGKLDRRKLPLPDKSRSQSGEDFVAPTSSTEQQLASIWCELLRTDVVGVNDNFFEIGGHSLLAVKLFKRMDDVFGCKLPIATLFHHGTVEHLAKVIDESASQKLGTQILTLSSSGIGRALYVMPGINGEVLCSKELVDQLESPVMGIQPSLDDVRHFSDFQETARTLAESVTKHQGEGPYALMGFSYGALMAYAVAGILREQGAQVDVLAAVDSGPGRRGFENDLRHRVNRIACIVWNLPFWACEEIRQFRFARSSKRFRGFFRRLYRRAKRGFSAPLEYGDIWNEGTIPARRREILQVAFVAFREYEPLCYDGKMTLIRAKAQSLLRGAEIDYGWRRYASDVDIEVVSGNHESILRTPNVEKLAAKLNHLLSRRDSHQ